MNGAVLDIQIMPYDTATAYLFLAINSYVSIHVLPPSTALESISKCVGVIDKHTYVRKLKIEGDMVMVGDIMKGLGVYQLSKEGDRVEVKRVGRDVRGGVWCMDMVGVDNGGVHGWVSSQMGGEVVATVRREESEILDVKAGIDLEE